MDDCDWKALSSIEIHALKKKFPGEHIALARKEYAERVKDTDLFHDVVSIDLRFIQKASFSPILGDSTAFKFMFNTLYPLTQIEWAKVFNYNSGPINNALTSILRTGQVLGPNIKQNEVLCSDSPLKLKELITNWNFGESNINSWLIRRSLSQLDMSRIEKVIAQVLEHKSGRAIGDLKGILVGVSLNSFDNDVREALLFAHETFSLVSLNPKTSKILSDLKLDFLDWTDTDPELLLLLDMDLVDFQSSENFWSRSIDIRAKESSELSDIFADVLSKNFSKWTSLSFLFDYLGSAKLALACEKIISKYDRRFITGYLHEEVTGLKSFAKILLDSIRKHGSQSQEALTQYLANNPSTISFVTAIELSLNPNLVPLFRTDADLLGIKSRMRNLNAYYERLHKACSIDLPKTDLALTL
jgi:hypothetical protein